MKKSKINLPSVLAEQVENSPLKDASLTTQIAEQFLPHILVVEEKEQLLATLTKGNAQDCDKAKRIALDLGSECSAMGKTKKSQKDYYQTVSRYIDGVYNATEAKARLVQREAQEISDYFANQEKERLKLLAENRKNELIPFCDESDNLDALNLSALSEDAFSHLVFSFQSKHQAKEKALEETKKKDALRVERMSILESETLKPFFNHSLDLGALSEAEWKAELKLAKDTSVAHLEKLKKLEEEKSQQELLNNREKRFYQLGFKLEGDFFVYEDMTIAKTALSSEKFEAAFEKLEKKVSIAQEKKAKEAAKLKEEQEKQTALLAKLEKEAKEAEALKSKILADQDAEKKRMEELKKLPENDRLISWIEGFLIPVQPELKLAQSKNKLESILELFAEFKELAKGVVNEEV
jgi:hypothetical protein